MSTDGSHVFWTSVPAGQLYVRINGTQTIQVSATHRAGPDPNGPQPAAFLGATPSGSKVVFTSAEKLTDDATASLGAPDLYEFDVASGQLTDLSVDNVAGESANVQGVVGMSDDGSFVYFAALGDLAPPSSPVDDRAPDGTPRVKIYLWHDGAVRRVAPMGEESHTERNWLTSTGGGEKQSRVSANGRDLLFLSALPLTGQDTAGHFEFFRYDAALDQLACVSCPPEGQPATVDAESDFGFLAIGLSRFASFQPRLMSSDGSRVFFETKEALVPQDVNGMTDVYEWEDGKLFLISPGRSASDAYFADASASGDDIFFTTYEQLVRGDRDTNMDLYDARVGGGFPESPSNGSCSGDACTGDPSPAPSIVSPGSASIFLAPARARSGAHPTNVTLAVSAISAKTRRAFARTGKVTLRVRSSAAGTVTARARGRVGRTNRTVARTVKRLAAAKTSNVTLTLSREAMRELRRRHRWTLRVSVAMAGARTRTATLTLITRGR
jgi:hypothetical protein